MTKRNAKVTIIVPVYNVEKYLKKCLDSLINQTYKNLEIIVIDDGSTDSSGKICDEYSANDDRIIVIHQKNSGCSVARNNGLDRVTGSYLTFVDSDDYLEENAIERFIEIAIKEKADMVIGEATTFFSQGISYLPKFDNEKLNTEELKEAILNDRIGSHVITKFYKRELWNNIRFPLDLIYEDFYIMPSICFNAQKIIYKCEPLYWYNRMNETSLTSLKNDFNAWHRYSKFKGYCEHLRIAELIGKNDIAKWAEKKALHEIVKAFSRNYGEYYLVSNVVEDMKKYLLNHSDIIKKLSFKDRVLVWSILNYPFLCNLYSRIIYMVFKLKVSKNRL
jgi:glycosyltransferase involved in cell wall biosynthesis